MQVQRFEFGAAEDFLVGLLGQHTVFELLVCQAKVSNQLGVRGDPSPSRLQSCAAGPAVSCLIISSSRTYYAVHSYLQVVNKHRSTSSRKQDQTLWRAPGAALRKLPAIPPAYLNGQLCRHCIRLVVEACLN